MPSSAKKTIKPQLPIALIMAAAGGAKLAGAQFTRDNFKRWGYADWWRPAIGAVEVGTAVAALAALKSEPARKLAAVGTLSTMGGAFATHTLAGEPAYNLIPPALLSALAVRVLFDITPPAEATSA